MNKILNINELNSEKTLIINVDMINGFITEGELHCSNIKRIVPNILELNQKLDKAVIRFFADAHEPDSLEFKTFPKHCLIGSTESQIIEELKELSKSNVVYYKSTTNGFWSYEFKKLLEYNSFENIIITGCCTDICVLNLALTLNTYFISINTDVNIIVVEDAVDTFDAPGHNADTYNIMSLNILKSNGIQVLRLHEQEDNNLELYPLTNEQRFTLECEIESMLARIMRDIIIPCPKCKKIMDKILYSNNPIYKCSDCNLKYRYEKDRLINVSLSRNYNNSTEENKKKDWTKL